MQLNPIIRYAALAARIQPLHTLLRSSEVAVPLPLKSKAICHSGHSMAAAHWWQLQEVTATPAQSPPNSTLRHQDRLGTAAALPYPCNPALTTY